MNVLDTFYLLFKSNAEDTVKGNKAVEKSTKDTERALKNTNDQTKEIGQNFVKMAEAGATALGAIAGFEILKGGVQQAIEMNTQLKLLGENAGMTAQQLRTAGEAARMVGGTTQMGMSDALAMANANMQNHISERDPAKMMQNLRARVSQIRDLDQRKLFLNGLGLSPAGIRMASGISDEEFAANASRAAAITKGTNEAADAAYAANKSEVALSGETQSFFNRLLDKVGPTLESILGIMQRVVGGTGPITGSLAVIGGSTVAGLGVLKILKSILPAAAKGAGKAAAGAAADSAGLEAGLGLGGASFASEAAAVGSAIMLPLTLAAADAALIVHGAPGAWRDTKALVNIVKAWAANRKTRPALSHALRLPSQADPVNPGLELPVDTSRPIAPDLPLPTNQDILNSPAAMKDMQRALNIQKTVKNAQNTLSIASQLSPAANGNGVNVTIEKIEIMTQATDASGIATGIAGALEDKIYTALGFMTASIDNGQSK